MEQIYLKVSQQIQSQVSEIRMIDLNYGQLEVLDQDMIPAVIMPCALIDINYTKCEDMGEGEQQVEARIVVRLAFRMPFPTDNLSPAQKRAKAIELMQVVRKVYKALQGWGTVEFSTLSRSRQTTNNRYPGVKVIDMEFTTTFIDT